jgi:Rod binding domain-containing protein
MSTTVPGISPHGAESSFASHPALHAPRGPQVTESPKERKLRQTAAEFESTLLANLWKSMKSSLADDDSEFSDPAHGALEDWGIETMSRVVGKAGGLGIASMILKHLEPQIAPLQFANQPSTVKGLPPAADTSP